MKKLFTFFAVAAMAFAVQAADWTAADGTATDEYAPVYGYNYENAEHIQMQYPVTELSGMAAGSQITVIKFYTSTPDAVNALEGSATVSLANLNEASAWSVDLWGDVSGNFLDVDVTVVATVTPNADADGVWTITLDAPFTYTGGALLVDVQTVAGEWKTTKFYGKEMGAFYVMCLYGYSGTTKKAQTLLPKATFTYEGGEEPGLATLAEANALEDAAEFKFGGDAVVTVQKGDYLFLRDDSGFGLIYGAVDGTFENGQVLSQGWSATKSDDVWVRFIDATGLSASGETNAELAAPIEATSIDASMLNAYVVYKNVTFSMLQRKITLPDGVTTIPVYNLFNGDMPGGNMPGTTPHYNFYGIIGMQGNTLKLIPVEYEKYVEPEPEWELGDVNHDHAVDVNDVTIMISYILGNDPEPFYLTEANVDGDAEDAIDVNDVTSLIAIILNAE